MLRRGNTYVSYSSFAKCESELYCFSSDSAFKKLVPCLFLQRALWGPSFGEKGKGKQIDVLL